MQTRAAQHGTTAQSNPLLPTQNLFNWLKSRRGHQRIAKEVRQVKLHWFINMTMIATRSIKGKRTSHRALFGGGRLPRSCKEKTEELWKAGEPLRNALRRLGMLMLTPLWLKVRAAPVVSISFIKKSLLQRENMNGAPDGFLHTFQQFWCDLFRWCACVRTSANEIIIPG